MGNNAMDDEGEKNAGASYSASNEAKWAQLVQGLLEQEAKSGSYYPSLADWPVDDGSAAHEPDNSPLHVVGAAHEPVTLGADAGPELSGNSLWLSAIEAQLNQDRARIEQLERRLAAADDPASKDGPNVAGDIERVIDHLVQGRTTRDQRKGLGDATERAERDAAVGRALR